MSASTQDIAAIEARLSTIEEALVRSHALFGFLCRQRTLVGSESQLEAVHELTGKACVAAFSLSAVDLEATTSATDIALRREQAERRAAMQEAISH